MSRIAIFSHALPVCPYNHMKNAKSLCLVALSLATLTSAQEPSPMSAGLPTGNYEVSFRTETLTDLSALLDSRNHGDRTHGVQDRGAQVPGTENELHSFGKMQRAESDKAVDLSDPDVAAIVQIARDFCTAWRNGDLSRIMEAYSPDVIKSMQGSPSAGKKELERSYADLMSKFDVQVEVNVEEVRIISSLMAFDRVTYAVELTPKAGGKTLVSKGRLLEVLRKENGKWLSFRAMGTVDSQ